MTRQEIEKQVKNIVEDIEPRALDDTGLCIPILEIEKAVDKIMELFDEVGVYEPK